jgi:cation diffusion facilitator CzcD-associated flavoprotein CzcO
VTDSADRSRPSDDEPGASYDYCYYFSRAPYSSWQRSEKYATQPELLRYLNHVADQFDIRRHFRFRTWLTAAQWNPKCSRYELLTSTGDALSCQFLVLATGNLSKPRRPQVAGVDAFRGEWAQTAA